MSTSPPRPEVHVDSYLTLRSAPLLRGFTDLGVRILSGAVQRRSVGRSTFVFRAGEPATALSFIARGTVHLVAREGGTALGELGPGESIAGFALLAGGEHLITALAATDVELLDLTLPAFRRLSLEKPQASIKLLLALANDLGERLQDSRASLREFLLWQISKRPR